MDVVAPMEVDAEGDDRAEDDRERDDDLSKRERGEANVVGVLDRCFALGVDYRKRGGKFSTIPAPRHEWHRSTGVRGLNSVVTYDASSNLERDTQLHKSTLANAEKRKVH